MRLVSTRTLQVVDVVSYQKQIIGRQVRDRCVFRLLRWQRHQRLCGGKGALEPIQLGVRAVVEAGGAGDHGQLSTARQAPEICLHDGDPIGGRTTGLTGSFYAPRTINLDAKQCADPRRSLIAGTIFAGSNAARR